MNLSFQTTSKQLMVTESPPPLGEESVIENPQFVYQPSSQGKFQYVLFASFGDYRVIDSYHTIKMLSSGTPGDVGFPTVIDGALISRGSDINPQNIYNPGGLSALLDTATENLLLFAAPKVLSEVQPRHTYWEPFSS